MIKFSDLPKPDLSNTHKFSVCRVELTEQELANSIKEIHNIDKLTNTIIDTYKTLLENNIFCIDKVIQKHTLLLNGKISYTLQDNSIVSINEDTQELLVQLLDNKPEIVEYMNITSTNFMEILRKI